MKDAIVKVVQWAIGPRLGVAPLQLVITLLEVANLLQILHSILYVDPIIPIMVKAIMLERLSSRVGL